MPRQLFALLTRVRIEQEHRMFIPQVYTLALAMMALSMICWGSWANTQKATGTWRFELYRETPTLFDPMAVALAINPSLCQTKKLAIEVDRQGFTRVVGEPTNATVGMETDPARFFEFYLSRVAAKP